MSRRVGTVAERSGSTGGVRRNRKQTLRRKFESFAKRCGSNRSADSAQRLYKLIRAVIDEHESEGERKRNAYILYLFGIDPTLRHIARSTMLWLVPLLV